MLGGQEEKKPQKMVRSSIACARCRRSKVKCKAATSCGPGPVCVRVRARVCCDS